MKPSWLSTLFLLLLCFTQQAYSATDPLNFSFKNLPVEEQQQVANQVASEEKGDAENADKITADYRTTLEKYRFYEVVVLAIVAVVSLVVVLGFIKSGNQFQPRDMVNATGLVLVIFSTIMVILLADVEVQLTAAMGVLGGIAGFLFGSFNSNVRSERKSESTPKTPEEDK